MVATLFRLWLTFLLKWCISFYWKSMEKRLIILFAFLFGIIGDYTVYLRILFSIGILVLYLGFGKIFLNLLVLNPG